MRQSFIGAKAMILGFAIFSMFFGAGNVIYPIELGVKGFSVTSWFAFMLTAIGAPLMGLYALILAKGDLNQVFSLIGKKGAYIASALLILALGPLGAMPRCVLLAHQAFVGGLFDVSLTAFTIGLAGILFAIGLKPLRALTLLGQVLSPLLFCLILLVTVLSLKGEVSTSPELGSFYGGLVQGYQTMDLLASLLFGATLWHVVSQFEHQSAQRERITLAASGIGALLLAFVYFGLALSASCQAQELSSLTGDLYLRKMAFLALGSAGGRMACLILFLACFTTLIALMMTCVDQSLKATKDPSPMKVKLVVMAFLLITMFVANLGFERLSSIIQWLVSWAYPLYIMMVAWFIAREKLPVLKSRAA